jgi:tetratricopeptide (TPR) repeat protein
VRWDTGRLVGLPRRHWRLTTALVLLAAGAAWAVPHLRAWRHLRAAQVHLERFRAAPARDHLRACLEAWPASPRVHLLASRAARLAGDFDEAEQHLRQAQRQGPALADEVVFEWALYRAARGDLGEVEEYLADRVRKAPDQAPLVWEALARGYLGTYRIADAVACLDRWLRVQPDFPPALALRGKVWMEGRAAKKALSDLERAVECDPADADARWDLALCLLDLHRDDRALPHLEHLRPLRPGDPEVLVRIARCFQMHGPTEQALPLLEAVLAEHPRHGLALRLRGQMALAAGSPTEAEVWLRQAVEVRPQDQQAQWALYQALLRQGKTADARTQMERAKRVEDQAELLAEITTRKMSKRPRDPAVHTELGILLIQMGQREAGSRWLLSALHLDQGYRPAHAALADHYQAEGDADRAAFHRQRANP